MAGPTRIRHRRVRVSDDLSDAKTASQIQLAIPSSITDEELQVFYLSRLREIIFGADTSKHWYDDFASLGISSMGSLSARKVNAPVTGTFDGTNRTFMTAQKFVHAHGVSIDIFHNGRRLVETSVPDPRLGDFFCAESGGPGSGFDTVILLSFSPSAGSALVADFQVAM